MAYLTGLVCELFLMRVIMAGRVVAGFIGDTLELTLLMALITTYICVLTSERIFCFIMIDLYLFPTISGMALFTFRFILMRIFMTGEAFPKLLNLIPVFYMTFTALYFNVFTC